VNRVGFHHSLGAAYRLRVPIRMARSLGAPHWAWARDAYRLYAYVFVLLFMRGWFALVRNSVVGFVAGHLLPLPSLWVLTYRLLACPSSPPCPSLPCLYL
jgi:hypothetical protein